MGYEWSKRPVSAPSERQDVTIHSTTGGTTIPADGVTALQSTSTGAPVLVTLATPLTNGMEKDIIVSTIGSSSDAPYHINMPSSNTTVNGTTADMITLSSQGAAVQLVALSSARWLVRSAITATYSTST